MGGTEIPMLEYARSLAKLGHDVTVYTANALSFRPSKLSSNEVKDEVRIVRFRFIPLPMKYSFLSIGLFRALLTTDVQVLQVFSVLPSFFILGAILVAKIRGIPLILYPQFHPNRFDYHPNGWVRVIGRIFDKSMAVYFIGLANHVICLTNLEERFYHTKGITKTTTIYEWVPRRTVPDRKAVDEFRSRLQISEEEHVILFVGRIDRRKGLDILIRALPSVIKNVPNTRLVVVGRDDGHLKECIDLARTLNCEDKIMITGQLTDEDLSAAYCTAEIVAIPSRFEAFGRTLLEAWTFHKPAVLTDRVALSEVATPGSGLVIRVGSVEQLADSIVSLLTDKELRERMGERGFRTLGETMLDLSDVMDITLDIYKNAIESRAQ
jgi:glycosyltransferase involved in cell wall biosynthesis